MKDGYRFHKFNLLTIAHLFAIREMEGGGTVTRLHKLVAVLQVEVGRPRGETAGRATGRDPFP